jgi:hypothetical protein
MQDRLTAEAGKTASEYEMLRCLDCDLEFASPLRAPGGRWYELAYQALDLYPSARWEFAATLNRFRPQDFVLEFGCGSGAFLKRCRNSGIKALGVDFSSDAVRLCHSDGLEARHLEVTQPVLGPHDPQPTHIVAFHLLEHLDNPRKLFEQARAAAGSNTDFWIAVPSSRRSTRKFGLGDFLDQPPHHMSRWADRTLAKIGARTGWRLEHLLFEPLPLRVALWSIATSMPDYLRRERAGQLTSRALERTVRLANYPTALWRRLTVDRDLTGFSMLARFCRA